MKNKIAAFLCLLIIMGMLPAAVVSLSSKNVEAEATSSTPDSAPKIQKTTAAAESAGGNNDISATIISAAAEMCKEDFCSEALRAAVILANTNYKTAGETADNNYNSDTELYKQLTEVYNSNKELYILHNGKAAYIPHSFCSNGVTVNSEKYDYIRSAASPWDCESDEYSSNLSCEGVSLFGVNYLCENGYSAEKALGWYLPDCEIKKL